VEAFVDDDGQNHRMIGNRIRTRELEEQANTMGTTILVKWG